MMDHHTLRRAAVLVASLKPGQADELIAQLSDEDAQRLAECVAELSAEDLATSEDVIGEFLEHHQDPNPDASRAVPQDLNATPSSAVESQTPNQTNSNTSEPDVRFLNQVPPNRIADFLTSVHGQIAAAILAGLPSEFAGVILSYFDAAKQQEVLERIAAGQGCSGEHLHAAMQMLEDQLLQIDAQGQCHRPRSDTKALEIRAAAQNSFRNRTIQSLDASGTDLGRLESAHPSSSDAIIRDENNGREVVRSNRQNIPAVREFTLRFEDLILLDDRSLAHVFHQADSQLILLALAGATVDFIQRITSSLNQTQKDRFNRQLQTLGPVSLQEIDQAQQSVAEIATFLANTGQIVITSQQPFRAAA